MGSTRSAHQVGVLHSDLTPANLMLLRDGRGRVLDVGLAQPLWRPSDAPAAAGGSPLYMVPEQRRGAACSDRTDCYALDLLLREMLTGEAPQPRGAAPAPPEDAQGAPPLPLGGARSLAELADRGLRPSAAEIEAALAACAAEFPASSTPAERPAAPLAEVPAGRHPAGAGQNAARPSGPLGWPRPPRRGALLLGGVLLSLGVLTSPPVSPAPADVLLGANRATLRTQGARYRALCAGLQRATPARCQVFPLPTRAPRAAKLAPDADLLLWLGRDGRLSLRGCIPRLFPLGSLALPPPSGDPDAAWELQGRVFAALAAVVHAKRGGALRPVPLPPCPRSATARRRRCWGPSRATTTILSDDAPPVKHCACAPQVRSCRPRSKK